MNILHKIRSNTVISQVLLLTLIFSLLFLPLTSWGASNHGMQTTSQSDDAMEMSTNVSITNCHHLSSSSNEAVCLNSCCDDSEINQNCKDCTNGCISTVFISTASESISQFINHYGIVINFQSAISSRKITPPFRPPITLLS
jgi:hypothetical protein